jgi:hypothetical protein
VGLLEDTAYTLAQSKKSAKKVLQESASVAWTLRWPHAPLPFRDIEEYLTGEVIAPLLSTANTPHISAWLDRIKRAKAGASKGAKSNRQTNILAGCIKKTLDGTKTYTELQKELGDENRKKERLANFLPDLPYERLQAEMKLKGYTLTSDLLQEKTVREILDLMQSQSVDEQ